jgi:3-dehydroquinate synthetase
MVRMECTSTRAYDVVMTSDVFDLDNHALSDALDCERGLVVLDSGVDSTQETALGEYLESRLTGFAPLIMQLSEESKTVDRVLEICAAAQRHRLGRHDLLVAVGGGVCCDLVSVAASLVRRGLPYVTVPTTLLAQVDAGIALKGAVNFGGHKNYLGCFRAPTRVLVDPGFLRSLPQIELRSGAAEMLKMAVVRDRHLFMGLREHAAELMGSGFASPIGVGTQLIGRSIELMLEELADNPYEERGLRRLVDFGHTFSTRLEELSGWQVRHGEAVAVDMALSSALAAELGLLTEEDFEEILELMQSLGLPLYSPLITESAAHDAFDAAVRHRGGALNLVVPTGLGRAAFIERPADVPSSALTDALHRMRMSDNAREMAPSSFCADLNSNQPGEGGGVRWVHPAGAASAE